MASENGMMDMMADMSPWELKQLVLRMSESLGENRSFELVKDAVGGGIRCDRAHVAEVISAALKSKEQLFFSGAPGMGFNECRSPADLAYMLSSEAVRESCRSEVSSLLKTGRSRDAEAYVRNIARTLDSARCAMTEPAPSCCRDIGDWFVHSWRTAMSWAGSSSDLLTLFGSHRRKRMHEAGDPWSCDRPRFLSAIARIGSSTSRPDPPNFWRIACLNTSCISLFGIDIV